MSQSAYESDLNTSEKRTRDGDRALAERGLTSQAKSSSKLQVSAHRHKRSNGQPRICTPLQRGPAETLLNGSFPRMNDKNQMSTTILPGERCCIRSANDIDLLLSFSRTDIHVDPIAAASFHGNAAICSRQTKSTDDDDDEPSIHWQIEGENSERSSSVSFGQRHCPSPFADLLSIVSIVEPLSQPLVGQCPDPAEFPSQTSRSVSNFVVIEQCSSLPSVVWACRSLVLLR